ncbi:MAG: phospholipase A [Tannerellaceae bacterium]|jgi:phospholipase A1|nr:phospholipase A [Tannerellaceae bacterium]
MIRFFLFVLVFQVCFAASAQLSDYYNADSIRAEIESTPSFGLYKDNYFMGGIPLNHKVTRHNADIKFQLSIQQRITKSKLPFKTYLFLQYTQQAYWSILENALPMRDINFNPALGIGHHIIYKGQYRGTVYLKGEHESNGSVTTYSRSWNKITVGSSLVLTNNFDVQFKTWYPIIDGRNNKDILHYKGIFELGGNYLTNDRAFNIGILFIKRKTWRLSFNTQIELSYKFNKKNNQYFFLQYYNGYGENLLEYKKYHSNLRLGFAIKPTRGFSFY